MSGPELALVVSVFLACAVEAVEALTIVLVALAGLAARAPLARVPENTMKLAVGVMLTSFGTFWGTQGAGAGWPGDDAALLAIIPGVALASLALTLRLRRLAHSASSAHEAGVMPAEVT